MSLSRRMRHAPTQLKIDMFTVQEKTYMVSAAVLARKSSFEKYIATHWVAIMPNKQMPGTKQQAAGKNPGSISDMCRRSETPAPTSPSPRWPPSKRRDQCCRTTAGCGVDVDGVSLASSNHARLLARLRDAEKSFGVPPAREPLQDTGVLIEASRALGVCCTPNSSMEPPDNGREVARSCVLSAFTTLFLRSVGGATGLPSGCGLPSEALTSSIRKASGLLLESSSWEVIKALTPSQP
mmetsp:Transcript_89274/g.230436  ORF Transcript_89274/g.230436 Transcript_89274/m.230436 type:complete len:238 (-) Transcript_89274:52-765(-)